MVVVADPLSQWACRRVEVKKAWAVHLAEQQQKQQQGSDAEEEEEAQDPATSAADAAEVPILPPTILPFALCYADRGSQCHRHCMCCLIFAAVGLLEYCCCLRC